MTRQEDLRLTALDRAITLHSVGDPAGAVLETATRFAVFLSGVTDDPALLGQTEDNDG